MRVDNCKNVCGEIEEADYGANLTASAIEHLGDCDHCRKFSNERGKLREMMASLETVAPPLDFDLRVRSRLADENSRVGAGFMFGNFAFGFPSIAVATLVLVIGTVFALRVWNAAPPNMVAVQTERPEATGTGSERAQPPATESGVKSNAESRASVSAKDDGGEVLLRERKLKNRSPLRSAVASSRNRRLATREFSSTAAPVVKSEEAIASLESSPVFLIEASSEPLRMSLDYSGGVSRTISVPTLSFGSERVLAGDGLSLVKNAPKGAW